MSNLTRQLSLPLLALAFAIAPTNAFAASLQDVNSAWSQGRLADAITAFDELPAAEQSTPSALFIAGACYFKRHDFRRAKPLLQRAVSGNLGPKQAQTGQTMLDHIQTLERLCPPFQRSYQSGGFTINLCANNNSWSESLAAQMPQFLNRATEAFGAQSAAINFYLFDERPPYDEFFSAWRIDGPQPEKHRGTGTMQMVEFCKFFPDGTAVGATNVNDLYSRVLHEYSHALCHTIYGDRFGSECPQWLNEGMADYFGWKYRPELYTQQAALLKRAAARIPAPSYDQLCHQFYSVDHGYMIADVLVLDLLEGQNVSCYRNIIARAKQNGGNFEAAMQEVTGKDPRAVYTALVRRYWQ